MPITDAGRNFLVQGAIAAASPLFNNANAHIGVGNSNVAFAAGQTALQGTSVRKAQDATYPLNGTPNVLTFRSTFGTSEANFAWEEWGVFNAATGGTMLARKVESLGTKTNTQTWQFTVTLTVTTA